MIRKNSWTYIPIRRSATAMRFNIEIIQSKLAGQLERDTSESSNNPLTFHTDQHQGFRTKWL